MDFAQGGGNDLDLRVFLRTTADHPEEDARIQLGLCALTSGPGIPRPFCRSSSLPTRTSTFSTMRATTSTALSWPPQMLQSFSRKLRSKRDDRARILGSLHPLENELAGRLRKRGENAAAVKPARRRRRRLLSSRNHRASAAPRLRWQRL